MHLKYRNEIKHLIQIDSHLFHTFIYLICFSLGLLFMSTFKFSDTISPVGDRFDYEAIPINLIHGHGFPISGIIDHISVYKFNSDINDTIISSDFGTQKNFYAFNRNPVYPIFVAVIYKIFSIRPSVLLEIQFILLIMAGSFLPLLCYKIMGIRGIPIGVLSYGVFIFCDYHIALEVMTESLVISYTIILLLLFYVLNYQNNLYHAIIMGFILSIGLLLKNYLIPFTIFFLLHLLYISFIRRQVKPLNTLALIFTVMITIAPWTIYVNTIPNQNQSFFFITTQGSLELLGANNEYALDGDWHPEWKDHAESLYNRPELQHYAPVGKVMIFYFKNIKLIPHIITCKILKGYLWFCSRWFYFTTLAFVILYKIRKRPLYLKLISLLGVCIFLNLFKLEPISHQSLELNTHLFSIDCSYLFIGVAIYILRQYFIIIHHEGSLKGKVPFYLLANFLLLTLVFYGNPRITGVVDFIFIILTFYNLFEIISMLIIDPIAALRSQDHAQRYMR